MILSKTYSRIHAVQSTVTGRTEGFMCPIKGLLGGWSTGPKLERRTQTKNPHSKLNTYIRIQGYKIRYNMGNIFTRSHGCAVVLKPHRNPCSVSTDIDQS